MPLGPRDVRIAVSAAGVNFVDALIVQGLYQIKPPTPFVPGGECVGPVVEVGREVTEVSVGERVFASPLAGAFASELVVPVRAVTRVPDALTDGQAATFLQSYLTAYFALARRATLRAGQSLLVLGAGGGVGLAAVDVGRALGLDVIAVASSAEKRALAESRGARATIDSSAGDAAAVKQAARDLAGGGVDAVYDPVGGALGVECLRALAEDGQFLVIGFASGDIPQLPANHMLLLNRRVIGVDLGGWMGRHPEAQPSMVSELMALVDEGRIDPVEPVVYPLDRVADALAAQQGRAVAGKTVVVP